jgi:hypothetical protein
MKITFLAATVLLVHSVSAQESLTKPFKDCNIDGSITLFD